jgi:hypothetical protein
VGEGVSLSDSAGVLGESGLVWVTSGGVSGYEGISMPESDMMDELSVAKILL